jgi:hypothetical protein
MNHIIKYCVLILRNKTVKNLVCKCMQKWILYCTCSDLESANIQRQFW